MLERPVGLALATDCSEDRDDGHGHCHFQEGKRALKLLPISHSRNSNIPPLIPSLRIFLPKGGCGKSKPERDLDRFPG
jgi:hypothetical protein